MLPVGILVLLALGIILAYAIPQQVRIRSDYALVRTEDRYSAEMRVVRSAAERLTQDTPARGASKSQEIPLLVTGGTRAQVAQVASERMSRPVTALDRAATIAHRERLKLRQERRQVLAERAQIARRRRNLATGLFWLSVLGLGLTFVSPLPALVPAIIGSATLYTVIWQGRTAAGWRKLDAAMRPMIREVAATATATQALRKVAAAKAQGESMSPSDLETQAIRVVTDKDLAEFEIPAVVGREDAALERANVEQAAETSRPVQERPIENPWRPRTMPVPTYALKPAIKQQPVRPIDEADLEAATVAAKQRLAAQWQAQQERHRFDKSEIEGTNHGPAADFPKSNGTEGASAADILAGRRRTAS